MSDEEVKEDEKPKDHEKDETERLAPKYSAATFWSRHSNAIVGALVGALAVSFIGPVRDWLGGAVDAAHDVVVTVRNYDAGKVDDLKERIQSRPYWEGDPDLQDESLNFVTEFGPPGNPVVTSFEELRPVIVPADEIAEDGFRFNGDPIIVIGRVVSSEGLEGDTLAYGTSEVVVTGANSDNFVILGLGGGSGSYVEDITGSVVLAQGVVTAVGRAVPPGDDIARPTAYFTVLQGLGSASSYPYARRYLQRFNR